MAINESIEKLRTTLSDITTSLGNKGVTAEGLKASQIPDKIREIQLDKIVLTVNCSEFDSGTIEATKDGKTRTGTVEGGQCVIKLPETGTWHIEHDLGDYVEVEVNNLESSCELVKKKVTFTEGDCTEDKIVVHIQSVVGNNSNDNYIRVKKNGVIIEVQAQLVGSDIEITNFEYEEGATYTIEYVLKDEVRGSIEVEIVTGSSKIETGIIGFNVTEAEKDPTNRISYNELAIDRIPTVVNFEDGTVKMDSWTNTWLLDKIYPAMVKFDGTIDYKLDRNDQTKKENGDPSDVNNINYEGNAMTVFEKFYTKFGMDGENEVIQFSDTPQEGFEAIGFIREDGSEADWCASGMFMGTIDDQGRLRSIGNQNIKYNTSFTDFRAAAQKCGTGYDIDTYAQNQVKSALEILMFKSCDWRNKLGKGRTYNNATNKKTGVLANKGGIAFDPTTKATKFLWIEDYVSWPQSGNPIYKWEAGILCKNKENYVRMKPPYSGTDTATYEKVTDHVWMQGYMNKMKADNKYGRIGVEASGAETTYETCNWYDSNNTSGSVYISRRGRHSGVAGCSLNNAASFSNDNIGAALSLVPPA